MRDITIYRQSSGSVMLGVTLIILGTVAVVAPLLASLILIKVLGWLLILAAIEQAVHAFRNRYDGGSFFRILLVILYTVVGVMLLRRPVSGAIAATAIVGILFLADGVMEIALGVKLRHKYEKSGWLFAGGILSLLFGAMILNRLPSSAGWVVGLLVGIRLVFKGVEQIARSSAATRADIERRAA